MSRGPLFLLTLLVACLLLVGCAATLEHDPDAFKGAPSHTSSTRSH